MDMPEVPGQGGFLRYQIRVEPFDGEIYDVRIYDAELTHSNKGNIRKT